ncbi:MAG TPA: FHA domain-containing protein [Lacipirellulaceae bacterium]|nr:FHA domain-containing protein [Lacipirellulaceae bacterium]
MDVILKVLEGAKAGAKIAVKKNEFIIGRSQSSHLCAGSSAISRQHCAILRYDNRVAIKDLGSRNGTLVNGQKIDAEVELASGDEIGVGPLRFMITISTGIANAKRPEVKSVAEAVERAAESKAGETSVDDISQWLLMPENSAFNETQTIRIDDTNAAHLAKELEAETSAIDVVAADANPESSDPASESGKKGPGKLPKMPTKPASKDSREAAAEALRAWSRRR